MRLFVAIALPQEVKAALAKAQDRLKASVSERSVKWSPQEQRHLTLKFLGNITEETCSALVESIRDACAGLGVLQLCTQGVGFFPTALRPRVIWAGVEEERQKLPELWRVIVAATRPFTTEAAESHFAGHVTLGRVKELSREEIAALAEAAQSMRDSVWGTWMVQSVQVIGSQLTAAGAWHSVVAEVQLG
jgi:2'-5' RNA ligase